jgi:hypothetical protein
MTWLIYNRSGDKLKRRSLGILMVMGMSASPE